MEKNNNTIVVALLALIAGLLIGYFSVGTGWYGMQNGMMSMMGGKDGSNYMMDGDEHDSGMEGTMDAMTSGMEGKTGEALEQAFLTEMIVHHQGAIDMSQKLLAGTKRPELVKLANDIIVAQEKEIGMMKQWLKEWFGK